MNWIYTVLIVCLVFGAPVQCKVKGNGKKSSEYVNTFIGSGGEGYGIGSVPPGAQAPFGPCRVGPDTINWFEVFIPWNHFGGYYYGDDTIRIFSHTHMVGSGAIDYGTVGVMPMSKIPSASDFANFGFKSYFSHKTEVARPGYYAVTLDTPQIRTELTATSYVGLHRYTWLNSNSKRVVLFDVSYTLTPNACKQAYVEIMPSSNEVVGYVLNAGSLSGRFGGVKTYFVAKFGRSFSQVGTWANGNINSGQLVANGTSNVGSYLEFGSNVTTLEFYVGLSFISIDQARTNLNAEVPEGSNFNSILNATEANWEEMLNLVEVKGGNEQDLIKFYTAVYHTFMSPSLFSEEGGVYLGFDNQVHNLDAGQKYYTDMSIWDTHRTQFPWLGLIQPNILLDIVKSLILMFEQGGDLPRWPFANGYTNCMIGTHAIIVIADAYFKGINQFDIKTAYIAMKQAATQNQQHAGNTHIKLVDSQQKFGTGRSDIEDWIKLGYIPFDKDTIGASETLEYAYDDWALGNVAGSLGFTADQQMFLNRSKNYKNVWNSKEKAFCPKTSQGVWNCPNLWINVFDERYVEGDAWQWRWFVPQDVDGLIDLFGSKEYFVDQLTTFFERSEYDPFNVLPNFYYWAGNEPDILAGYLFDFAGRPDLTQKYVRWNMDKKFTTLPDGLPGNDDYGTMSAWYIFGALGFYPLAGSDTFLIGSPIFEQVTLHRESGDLTVKAYNASTENIYVQKMQINGVAVNMTVPMFHFKDIQKETVIEFWMMNKAP